MSKLSHTSTDFCVRRMKSYAASIARIPRRNTRLVISHYICRSCAIDDNEHWCTISAVDRPPSIIVTPVLWRCASIAVPALHRWSRFRHGDDNLAHSAYSLKKKKCIRYWSLNCRWQSLPFQLIMEQCVVDAPARIEFVKHTTTHW